MNKRILLGSCLLLAVLMNMPTAALAASQQVRVTLPDFPVTVNGMQIDNKYSQYPLIVYQDITYFPMTYHSSRFLNVKINWYENKQVLFIGKAEEQEKVLQMEKTTKPNQKSYVAIIPTYEIAVNTTNSRNFLNNSKEPYPILNFRDVTYFPLIWRFAVEEFGWEYSFDVKEGLVIKSGDMFRPVLKDDVIGNTSPHRGVGQKDYCYSEEYYVGYPTNTINENYDLIVCKRGEKEKIYSLAKQLAAPEEFYYFNQQYDAVGLPTDPTAKIPPAIDNNIFSIYCIHAQDNILLQIDLTNGELIHEEIIPR